MNEEMTLFDLGKLPTSPRPEAVKEEQTRGRAQDTNPCVTLYGPSPHEGQTCKGCLHLRYPHAQGRSFWKCDLRRLTHGHATDHKVRYPACARYEARVAPYHGG